MQKDLSNLSDIMGLNVCLQFGNRVNETSAIQSMSWLEFYHHFAWSASREGIVTLLAPFKEFWLQEKK